MSPYQPSFGDIDQTPGRHRLANKRISSPKHFFVANKDTQRCGRYWQRRTRRGASRASKSPACWVSVLGEGEKFACIGDVLSPRHQVDLVITAGDGCHVGVNVTTAPSCTVSARSALAVDRGSANHRGGHAPSHRARWRSAARVAGGDPYRPKGGRRFRPRHDGYRALPAATGSSQESTG